MPMGVGYSPPQPPLATLLVAAYVVLLDFLLNPLFKPSLDFGLYLLLSHDDKKGANYEKTDAVLMAIQILFNWICYLEFRTF